jgi:orotidine-5'-phosphate decarboxylase
MSTYLRRVIVALDVPEASAVLRLARQLGSDAAMVKIGLEAFVGHGPDLVRQVRDSGAEVFLDLKLHDIPRTAAAAARRAVALDVRLLTIHAAGGPDMVRAVVDAVGDRTQVVAVTMLTSLDAAASRSIGFAEPLAEAAARLGALARDNGAHGLVCSPHELRALAPLGGVRVVPGVRPAGAAAGDQKRVATPAEAAAWGATWIVVGRPILEAADPVRALREIQASLGEAAP